MNLELRKVFQANIYFLCPLKILKVSENLNLKFSG